MNDKGSEGTSNEIRLRHRVLNAAMLLLARHGLTEDLLSRAAEAADCPLEKAKTFFRSADELVLSLYARFAAELEARVVEFPTGGVAERFEAMMNVKFEIVAHHRETLAALTASLLDPRSEIAALSPHTEVIRARVQGILDAVITGASDRPDADNDRLKRMLYGVHLGLMMLWCQDTSHDSQAARQALNLVRDLLQMFGPFLNTSEAEQALTRVDSICRPLLEPSDDAEFTQQAIVILRRLFQHRRLERDSGECGEEPCPQCFALHLPRLKYFLRANLPIHFVLPAFPAKSPSRRKTLGPLPDKAEEMALQYLEGIGDDIQKLHTPGVRITICSDGHVFSDLVCVSDTQVTEYGAEVSRLIAEMNLQHLDTFQMANLYERVDYEEMRSLLVRQYAQTVDDIRMRAERFAHARSLFNGIHRFLSEEQADIQPERSRTQVRKECHEKAYEVIQRSNAWSQLLSECFPMALRLSIHPQHPHSEKIGVLLGRATNTWLTPWHGAAVQTVDGWMLIKREEAEQRGAQVVDRDGRPMYLEMTQSRDEL